MRTVKLTLKASLLLSAYIYLVDVADKDRCYNFLIDMQCKN